MYELVQYDFIGKLKNYLGLQVYADPIRKSEI